MVLPFTVIVLFFTYVQFLPADKFRRVYITLLSMLAVQKKRRPPAHYEIACNMREF